MRVCGRNLAGQGKEGDLTSSSGGGTERCSVRVCARGRRMTHWDGFLFGRLATHSVSECERHG